MGRVYDRSSGWGKEPGRADLVEIMAGVAERHPASIGLFYEVASTPVRSLTLRAFRQRNVRISNDLAEDIVRDLLLELVQMAPSWRPDGGAAPWSWAEQRLVSLAFARAGQFCADIDAAGDVSGEDTTDIADGCSAEGWTTLQGLAPTHPELALLARCLLEGCSERDRKVWIDFVVEKGNGNRSPAVTVAELHAINPALVRKVVQRVKERLRHLATTDVDYADLLDVPALAA